MNAVTCHISMSLDGYVAGPNQSMDDPIGEGGMRLHQWAFATDRWREGQGKSGGQHNIDSDVIDEVSADIGATIMGRKMFGGGDGPWDMNWNGWWGEDPPYHTPVFVLSHHERQPLPMQGGTTFTFVNDGIESALKHARAAAGEKNVAIAGGADTVQQYLRAGLLDELYLHIAPVILGSGERLLDNIGDTRLEIIKAINSPKVTHIHYRVIH